MSVIDDYLDKVAAPQKAELERIRRIIKETVPDAQEVISYGMPGFKYKNKYLVGFNAFKDHMSLFPTAAPIEALKARLEGFTLSKGTIQFTLEHPIPESVIKAILRDRVAGIASG